MVRTTQDAVIIAEMRLMHLEPFLAALRLEFYMDDQQMADAIKYHSSFNIIHRESIFKVDVFIPSPRPFMQSQLARVRRHLITLDTEVSANFASPEDTILSKLEWCRMGGHASERQWRDVLGVIKTLAEDLDLSYLEKWATELKISDLLNNALKESR
jgi:hypothetical protein